MPVSPTYPGVYIEELQSGVRPVIGVATSITAFVGYAPLGPENRAVRLANFGDYERRFGGIDRESEMSFAVQQFFRNGGSDALVVRVPKSDAVAATINLMDGIGPPAPKVALVLKASSTGAWGNNIVVDVDLDGVPAADTTSFNLTVRDLGSGKVERFTNLSISPDSPQFAVTKLNDVDSGSSLVVASVANNAGGRPLPAGTQGADLTLPLAADATKDYKLTISPDKPGGADSPGAVEVTVLDNGERVPSSIGGLCALVERKINTALARANHAAGLAVRVLPSGSGKGVRIVGDVDAQVAPGATDAAFTVAGVAAAGSTADGAALLGLGAAVANVGRYSAAGTKRLAQGNVTDGANGTTLPDANALVGSEGTFTGIYALLKTDLFNILCIPDATRTKAGSATVLDDGLDLDVIWSAAYDLCVRRRAMLMIDPDPDVADTEHAVDWINSLSVKGPNAVAHFPRLRIPDPTDDFRPRTVAPSGTLAGLYARTDGDRGVWKAPAGIDARIRGVSGLTYTLTDAENGLLNPLGLNCAARVPGDRHRQLGRPHHRRRRPARQPVEVRAGAAPRPVHRGERVPRHAMGGVRAQRRAVVVAAAPEPRRRSCTTCSARAPSPVHRRATPTSSSATPRPPRPTTSTAASSTSSSDSPR